MNAIYELNGFMLFDGFLSGYENLSLNKKKINDINVFPVPDGDTGTNMISTFRSTLQIPTVSRSVSRTMGHIADRALSGARGNSGIIVAHYLNALAGELGSSYTVNTREFGNALRRAAQSTYGAVERPREGTLLTLLRVWSDEVARLAEIVTDFRDLISKSLDAAQTALKETTAQLEELARANVVDAGASGFVTFIEGICRMIATGSRPTRQIARESHVLDDDGETHVNALADEPIAYRYCTEALLSARAEAAELRSALAGLGDSLVVSPGRDKTKIHLHTNDPAIAFLRLRSFGSILEQKVDDMILQRDAVHRPVSKIAIVTDSIADIPKELADRLQIHVIPQRILWGDDEYLDRVTVSGATFYPYLDERTEYPSSSIPDPKRVEQVYSWLATHYESIIAIPVGKALSGTWQVLENAAQGLRETGYAITVVDSKLNSAAQGLAVLTAAECAAEGKTHAEILSLLESVIVKARIFVSVATFKYMVRGGRVSALKGLIAAIIHLKPIVSLDERGKGIAFGASASLAGSERKLLSIVAKNKKRISRLAVVHAAAPERAARIANAIRRITGIEVSFIGEISPAVGIHAGVGAIAIAWI